MLSCVSDLSSHELFGENKPHHTIPSLKDSNALLACPLKASSDLCGTFPSSLNMLVSLVNEDGNVAHRSELALRGHARSALESSKEGMVGCGLFSPKSPCDDKSDTQLNTELPGCNVLSMSLDTIEEGENDMAVTVKDLRALSRLFETNLSWTVNQISLTEHGLN